MRKSSTATSPGFLLVRLRSPSSSSSSSSKSSASQNGHTAARMDTSLPHSGHGSLRGLSGIAFLLENSACTEVIPVYAAESRFSRKRSTSALANALRVAAVGKSAGQGAMDLSVVRSKAQRDGQAGDGFVRTALGAPCDAEFIMAKRVVGL